MLGLPEIFAILFILLILFGPKRPKRLAAEVAESLQRFQHGHLTPRRDLRGAEWLALALLVLFLELIYLATQY